MHTGHRKYDALNWKKQFGQLRHPYQETRLVIKGKKQLDIELYNKTQQTQKIDNICSKQLDSKSWKALALNWNYSIRLKKILLATYETFFNEIKW